MTQPISAVVVLNHVPVRRRGRKTGGARKAVIRRRASRVEGQCCGEIGQLHGRRKPSVTTSLLFHSSLPIRLSTPRVILGTVSLSHAALMASVCVCACVNVCISAWIRPPVCGAETCFGRFSCPKTYSQLLRRFWEQSERKRRNETGSSPRIDFYPLLDSP